MIQSCATNPNVNANTNSQKEDFPKDELISGQWLDFKSINNLKLKKVSEPHPFSWEAPHVDIITCLRDEKPYFRDLNSDNGGFLEKKEDHYLWTESDSKSIKIQFDVSDKDTSLRYEYRYRINDPFIYKLTKSPRATPCLFNPFQDKAFKSGISKSYNFYYFEGKYEVISLLTALKSEVEIFSDQKISGLAEVDRYSLETWGSHLMLELYEVDPKRNKQYLVLVPKDYGYDLHNTNFNGKGSTAERLYQVLEKKYEFRRK